MQTFSKIICFLFALTGLLWMIYGIFASSDIIFIKGLLSVFAARYFNDNN